ncbi:hypothetical protein DENIS_3729 [Desulfonema ishimotonii]|uniref:Uncharacterized protein n=1 Tax=Desulfonema ishimotonii TaxID=45657 RepID=A0A401G0J4_9BACT|nr:hypothetical protein [Desulfonema ishimotonii]GBC62752.1 hypothetical protein DENIS_3729 [Desulfonema ishimotonii]
MTQHQFSPEDIDRLSREIDARLAELSADDDTVEAKWIRRGQSPVPMPEKEAEAIEKTVAEAGETPESFWKRFQKVSRQDICEEGGVLNKQWKKWGDLSNEKVLKQFGAILVAMGFSGNALQVLALSCGVVVIHLGVKAYCMEAATSDSSDAKRGAK